jgi:hypothetical protein
MNFTSETLEYLGRITATPASVIGRWLTHICPECEAVPGNDDQWHVVDEEGYVLVACEAYWVVNPNAIGMVRPDWMDWTERAETERRMDAAVREGLGLPADASTDVVHDAIEDAMRDVEPDDDGE